MAIHYQHGTWISLLVNQHAGCVDSVLSRLCLSRGDTQTSPQDQGQSLVQSFLLLITVDSGTKAEEERKAMHEAANRSLVRASIPTWEYKNEEPLMSLCHVSTSLRSLIFHVSVSSI